MIRIGKSLIALTLVTAALISAARAADETEAANARTRVATAVALANIGMADKDGDALLVAAKLLATAGAVAKQGEAVADGKPSLYEIGDLIMKAKEYGADAGKADAVAKMSTSATAAARTGYWYYSCDSYNNCAWIWAGY